eukprot:TRINITY_DN41630_c0_g1_i1.p1 TRINITY_DN41630_c0_g1~~TRINITY_DN41630_c0_g1_i1.p1  ORF type:complete len:353 (-),score=54.91 TRINITY_DN41630_c0_g1_i1:9-1004(-)
MSNDRKATDDLAVAKADRRIFFATALAHGGARVLAKVGSAPLERLKICIQVDAAPGVHRQSFGGGLRLAQNVVAQQGVRAFWKGAPVHISGICLGTAARLSLLRYFQMWTMPGGGKQYQGVEAYARGCAFQYAAGATALVIAYPTDVAYTCLAADMAPAAAKQRFRGSRDLWKFVVKEHGLPGLYRGLPLCLATALPFMVTATAAHDLLAPRLMKRLGQAPDVDAFAASHSVPPHLWPWNLLVGAAAGFLAQSATYPLDTVRRRWQFLLVAPEDKAKPHPRRLRELAREMYQDRGLRGLYAGYTVNALKLIPELCVLCAAYWHINHASNFV